MSSDGKVSSWIQVRKWSHLRDTLTLQLGKHSYKHGKVFLHSSVLLGFQRADPKPQISGLHLAHSWNRVSQYRVTIVLRECDCH